MALGIDFKDVEESQDYGDRPGAGVYCCKIAAVEHKPDKQYVLAYLDFADGDFKGRGKAIEDRTGQMWGYISCYFSYKPKALGMTKHNIALVAESSKCDAAKLCDDFNSSEGNALVGKYIGIVIGEQEYEKQDGSVGVRFKLPKLVLVQDAKNNPEKFKVPELEKLAGRPAEKSSVIDEEVPF